MTSRPLKNDRYDTSRKNANPSFTSEKNEPLDLRVSVTLENNLKHYWKEYIYTMVGLALKMREKP